MQWPLRHICGNVVLAYLPQREIEMSDPPRPTDIERPRRAAQGRGALGAGARDDPGRLRLRVTRRVEPDMRRLVEWVLNITQARYDAHRAGDPDPYDLPLPDELAANLHGGSADTRDTMEPEPLHQRRSTA